MRPIHPCIGLSGCFFSSLIGYDASEVVGRPFSDIFSDWDINGDEAAQTQVLRVRASSGG
jgi:hypothetical protein